MGHETSKLEYQTPRYYVDNVHVTVRSVMVLDQSIKNIIHGSLGVHAHRNVKLPFTDFYSAFYFRLNELEGCSDSCSGCGGICEYFNHDIEIMSRFLIRLVKLVVDSPKHLLLCRKNGKWQQNPRRKLKQFVDDYRDIKLDNFEDLGEALFYAVAKTDDMHTAVLRQYWVDAYSVLLKQLVPIAQRPPKRSRRRSARKSLSLRSVPETSIRAPTPMRSLRGSSISTSLSFSSPYPSSRSSASSPGSNSSFRLRSSRSSRSSRASSERSSSPSASPSTSARSRSRTSSDSTDISVCFEDEVISLSRSRASSDSDRRVDSPAPRRSTSSKKSLTTRRIMNSILMRASSFRSPTSQSRRKGFSPHTKPCESSEAALACAPKRVNYARRVGTAGRKPARHKRIELKRSQTLQPTTSSCDSTVSATGAPIFPRDLEPSLTSVCDTGEAIGTMHTPEAWLGSFDEIIPKRKSRRTFSEAETRLSMLDGRATSTV